MIGLTVAVTNHPIHTILTWSKPLLFMNLVKMVHLKISTINYGEEIIGSRFAEENSNYYGYL